MTTTVQSVNQIGSEYLTQVLERSTKKSDTSFDAIFQSAIDMIQETNDLSSAAEAEELKMALGYSDNANDLMTALTKSELAVQYTVAVKNKVLEAYREIMNIQV